MQDVYAKLYQVCHGKSGIQQEENFFHQKDGRKFKEEPVECYVLSINLYTAESLTFRKIDQKYLESSEVLY